MFKKGQSGNPGGTRRQSHAVTLAAREYTESAIQTLAEIVEDSTASKSARVRAAEALLDRGWGKAPQTVNLNTNPLENLGVAELEQLERAIDIASELAAGGDTGATAASTATH